MARVSETEIKILLEDLKKHADEIRVENHEVEDLEADGTASGDMFKSQKIILPNSALGIQKSEQTYPDLVHAFHNRMLGVIHEEGFRESFVDKAGGIKTEYSYNRSNNSDELDEDVTQHYLAEKIDEILQDPKKMAQLTTDVNNDYIDRLLTFKSVSAKVAIYDALDPMKDAPTMSNRDLITHHEDAMTRNRIVKDIIMDSNGITPGRNGTILVGNQKIPADDSESYLKQVAKKIIDDPEKLLKFSEDLEERMRAEKTGGPVKDTEHTSALAPAPGFALSPNKPM